MPIQLITGPANSEKAGVVLDAYRAALHRRPILVVPTRADVDHYRRELVATGAVLGVRVERFAGLVDEAARRAGVGGRPVGPVARRRLAGAAVATAGLDRDGRPGRGPRFVDAALELIAGLEAARIEPARLTAGLRAWAGDDRRRAFALDLAGVYRGYRDGLERVGRTDTELYARMALDGLRLNPGCWAATPVFFYGFDDFTPVELDAIETLGRSVDSDVCVSLPHEAGRLAFAGRAGTFHVLEQLADHHVALAARDAHYAGPGRAALHQLERGLFEPVAARSDASDAIELLEGQSELAELELVAGRIGSLLDQGWDPADIAVVMRSEPADASLVARAFGAAGVPHTIDRRASLGDTALGGGLIALLRAALLDGGGAAVVRWLRTPGVVERAAHVDRLERDVRRSGLDTAGAIAAWERDRWPLDAIVRLRAAAAAGPGSLADRVEVELQGLFERPRAGAAAVLDELAVEDARALTAARVALAELRELSRGRFAAGPSELVGALEAVELRSGTDAADAVLVCDPLGLRARRVRALAACRLQEGSFPRAERPDPFFAAGDRAELARATGIVLPRSPDWLDAERYLFYATVSRPTERLILSWHLAGDDGAPRLRSLFVDDVCDRFRDLPVTSLSAPRERPPPAAPGEPGPLRITSPAVLAQIGERPAFSASALELWARCPVRWLVERQLDAEDLEPESPFLVRGRFAHDVLSQTLPGITPAPIREAQLPRARALLREKIEELAPRYMISTNPDRMRAAVAELAVQLERYLDDLARSGGSFAPTHFELPFGGLGSPSPGTGEGDAPALLLADGRLPVRGRIDRVDLNGSRAIVHDYKGARIPKPDDWLADRIFQLPIYMLAVEQLLDVEVVGGFYQPLGPGKPSDRRPRGVLADGADDGLDCVRGDRRDAVAVRELIDAAVAQAVAALDELRAGAVAPRPATCTLDGRCAHPGICRIEVA